MSNRINITRREFQDSYRRHYKMYRETRSEERRVGKECRL